MPDLPCVPTERQRVTSNRISSVNGERGFGVYATTQMGFSGGGPNPRPFTTPNRGDYLAVLNVVRA